MPSRREFLDALEHPAVAGAAIVAAGTLAFGAVMLLTSLGRAKLPPGVIPPQPTAAPFAEIRGKLAWPVLTNDSRRGQVAYTDVNGDVHGSWARRFGAPRDGRRHAGVDLFGDSGDIVVAIADGTVVNTQSFHLGSDGILVEHDGAVVLYGEVRPNSWNEFGVGEGSRVRAGDPIARIACLVGDDPSCASHMLHLETYAPGTRQNLQWKGSSPPAALRDPTYLLLTAAPAEANV